MKTRIRSYRPADFDSVAQISLLAFAPIYDSFQRILGKRIFGLVYPDWRKSQRNYLKSLSTGRNRKNIFVIEADGQVVGFVSFFNNLRKKSGEIGLNGISPEYQGQGLGTTMYRHVLTVLKKRGIRLVDVSTGGDKSHESARRVYKKVGFKPLPLVRFYKTI